MTNTDLSRQAGLALSWVISQSVYAYDGDNRLDCTAVRMNAAVFGSLPSSACTLGTEGSNGPDRITRNAYDFANRITQVTTAYGTAAQQVEAAFSYSANGQRQTLTDAVSNLTTFEYDGFDRLRKIRFPQASDGTISSTTDYEQYTYDANSNVAEDRRRDGATITLAYDNLNRPITQTPSTGDVVSNDYDLFGRLTETETSTHTLTFAYDALSRNTSAVGPNGTLAYQYDLASQRTRITWPDTFYAQYDYDLTGAVTAIRENGATSGAGVLATYGYDNLGRRTGITRGNGVATTYAYDAASRLDELSHDLASTTNDQTYEFTYNTAGQALSRDGSNANYDWSPISPGTQGYSRNGLNQYPTVGGSNFTYDGRGNLTSDGTTSYGYDVYNRLTSAGSATLAYDPAGRLYQTSLSGTTTRFQYDGVDLIAEYNTSGTLLKRYVHGPAFDEPVVWYEGSGTSDRRWLVTDQLGSVVAVTNGSGAATNINTYDEYGLPGPSNAGRFQYTGQSWIPEASLYNYKARFYSPAFGRFMQSDPVLWAGGINLYAYVGNDPVNWIDVLGLDPKPCPVGVICIEGRRPPSGDVVGADAVALQPSFSGRTTMPVGAFGEADIRGEGDEIIVICDAKCAYYLATRNAWQEPASILGDAYLRAAILYAGGGAARSVILNLLKQLAAGEIPTLPRTGSAARKDDLYHDFPALIDRFARYGTAFPLRKGATLYQLPGTANGVVGRFEWIIQNGSVTHRMFVPNGTVNGIPIVR